VNTGLPGKCAILKTTLKGFLMKLLWTKNISNY